MYLVSAMCTWDCAVGMDTLWLCSCLHFSDFTKDVMNLCFILYFAAQHFIFTIVAYFDELQYDFCWVDFSGICGECYLHMKVQYPLIKPLSQIYSVQVLSSTGPVYYLHCGLDHNSFAINISKIKMSTSHIHIHTHTVTLYLPIQQLANVKSANVVILLRKKYFLYNYPFVYNT